MQEKNGLLSERSLCQKNRPLGRAWWGICNHRATPGAKKTPVRRQRYLTSRPDRVTPADLAVRAGTGPQAPAATCVREPPESPRGAARLGPRGAGTGTRGERAPRPPGTRLARHQHRPRGVGRSPRRPAHSGRGPAHTPVAALSRPAAPGSPLPRRSPLRAPRACALRLEAPRPSPRGPTWYGPDGGWRPPRPRRAAGFSNLTFGGVAAAPAAALDMEGPSGRGPELRLAGLPAQQVSLAWWSRPRVSPSAAAGNREGPRGRPCEAPRGPRSPQPPRPRPLPEEARRESGGARRRVRAHLPAAPAALRGSDPPTPRRRGGRGIEAPACASGAPEARGRRFARREHEPWSRGSSAQKFERAGSEERPAARELQEKVL